jgi:hypothetical protein
MHVTKVKHLNLFHFGAMQKISNETKLCANE